MHHQKTIIGFCSMLVVQFLQTPKRNYMPAAP